MTTYDPNLNLGSVFANDLMAGAQARTALRDAQMHPLFQQLAANTQRENLRKMGIENQYLPDKLKQQLLKAQLYNQYYGPNIQSEIDVRNAQSRGLIPAQTRHLNAQSGILDFQSSPEYQAAEIEKLKQKGRGRRSKIGTLTDELSELEGNPSGISGASAPNKLGLRIGYGVPTINIPENSPPSLQKALGGFNPSVPNFALPIGQKTTNRLDRFSNQLEQNNNQELTIPPEQQANLAKAMGVQIPTADTLPSYLQQTQEQQVQNKPLLEAPEQSINQGQNNSPNQSGESEGRQGFIDINNKNPNYWRTQLAIQKESNHPKLVARAQLANVMDRGFSKTAELLQDAFKYAGLQGKTNLTKDQVMSAFNKTPKALATYNKFIKGARELLANQIRQFYGDSIQPTAVQHYKDAIYDKSMENNPLLAYDQFMGLADFLHQEAETIRGSGTGLAFEGIELHKGRGIRTPEASPESLGAIKNNEGIWIPRVSENNLSHPDLGNFTQKDLEHTAKKNNISVAELKKQLGVA